MATELCDFINEFEEIDLDEDSPIELDEENEMREEISLDEHNFDISLIENEETQEISIEKFQKLFLYQMRMC